MSRRILLFVLAVPVVACGVILGGGDDAPPPLENTEDGLADAPSSDVGSDASSFRASLYVVGGVDTLTVSDRVYAGTLEGGRITWKPATLHGAVFGRGGAFVHGGYLWSVGGANGGLIPVTPRRSLIGTGLVTWEDVSALGQPRFDVAVAARNDEVFVIGGNASSTTSRTVDRGALGATGVTWSAAPLLPDPRRLFKAVAVGPDIAVAGGRDEATGLVEP